MFEKIYSHVLLNPGCTAREISQKVLLSKSEVNKILHGRKEIFYIEQGSSPPKWRAFKKQADRYAVVPEAMGMLQYLKYKTGHSGHLKYKRHVILSRVMERPLPAIKSKEYMEQWGEPMSRVRFEMLIRSLNAFKNTRQDPKYGEAIRDWEEDLKFLREAYGDRLS